GASLSKPFLKLTLEDLFPELIFGRSPPTLFLGLQAIPFPWRSPSFLLFLFPLSSQRPKSFGFVVREDCKLIPHTVIDDDFIFIIVIVLTRRSLPLNRIPTILLGN